MRRLFGVEINHRSAREAVIRGLFVVNAGAVEVLPWVANAFDIVFTVGMLIHVAPSALTQTMRLIAKASSRYVLAVEYEAPSEVEVEYRGKADLLWKRNYGQLYANDGLVLVESMPLTRAEGFDDCTAWLFRKGRA